MFGLRGGGESAVMQTLGFVNPYELLDNPLGDKLIASVTIAIHE